MSVPLVHAGKFIFAQANLSSGPGYSLPNYSQVAIAHHNRSSNRSPHRIQCIIVALTDLLAALTGFHIGYSSYLSCCLVATVLL